MDLFGVQGGARGSHGEGPDPEKHFLRPKSGTLGALGTLLGTPWTCKRSKNGYSQRSSPPRVDFGSFLGSVLGSIGRHFGVQILIDFWGASWSRLGAVWGAIWGVPGRPGASQNRSKNRSPERERTGDEKWPEKRPGRAFQHPKIVKNHLVFIVFPENRLFGARAAAETEKASKMTPKSSQKGGPEGTRNGQKSDPEK